MLIDAGADFFVEDKVIVNVLDVIIGCYSVGIFSTD